jgi:hypothetical protein
MGIFMPSAARTRSGTQKRRVTHWSIKTLSKSSSFSFHDGFLFRDGFAFCGVVVSAGLVVAGVGPGVADGVVVGGCGFIVADGFDFPEGGLVNWS